ncbi:MAG: flavocytochrome C [Roseateles depolymerans]|uniref:Flavocytochrome C n=1 Tax=Roseateles depolymerans TaxID=76731 RepID=A0A2W5DG27_9BURK|nr:MAG: flavocytochrome C [Roseateles depolymerans]
MSAGLTRRGWLALSAAQGLTLAGCATGPAGASPGRVLVVGGGFGGATAARYLKLWGGAVEVTLVERQPRFVSCPMSNLVVAGQRDLASISHGYAGLQALGVRCVQGEVVGLDPAAKTVQLADGRRLQGDRLVLAPGVDFMPETVPGLAEALASGRAVHAWKAGPQTELLRRQLQALPDGGVVALSIPKAPYRCPPGPYERACLVAEYLKRAKPRAKLLVLDANPEIQSKRALFERAFAEHYAGVLEYRPNAELKEVAGGVARFEFEDVRADVLNLIPPQRAGDLVHAAGLAQVNRRWVGVDWLSMEAQGAPGVHVLGDAIFSAPLMPKSGHLANQQAKLAAAAILQLLKGEPVNPAPVVMNTCYSFVSASEAIHVASVHQYDATERLLKVVAGAGGVSARASVAEAGYALGWADNIWADSLAL